MLLYYISICLSTYICAKYFHNICLFNNIRHINAFIETKILLDTKTYHLNLFYFFYKKIYKNKDKRTFLCYNVFNIYQNY